MISLLRRKTLNKLALWISYVKLIPILKRVDESSLIIDCGANKGDISALFLNKNATVIAFEPDPLAFDLLQKRFEGNDNIECINKAVHDEASKAKLYFHEDRQQNDDSAYTVSSSLIQDKINIDADNSIEIETVDLDCFISKLNRPVDLLKLDVEGAEICILNKLIRNKTYKKIGLILVETHENKIPRFTEKVEDLKAVIFKLQIDNIKLNWI
jgi:FkbM family methyltransferase